MTLLTQKNIMKTQIIPKSWRESVDELREDLTHTINRWLHRLKPDEREAAAKELELDFWHQPLGRIFDQPRIDVQEHDDEIIVQAELPGLKKEDLKVDLDGRRLTLYGQKEESREEKRGRSHISELRFGSFTRVIPLPCEVDHSNVQAKYRRGLLKLVLPKTEAAKARRIPVTYVED